MSLLISESDAEDIHQKLKDKLKRLTVEEKANLAFVALLNDMANKTQNGAQALNPLKDKPGVFLDRLAATPVIADAANVFQHFVNPSSLKN